MNKMLEKVNSLSLSSTIVMASIILGGFYFMIENNKQKSIERQQEARIQEDRVRENKEYIARQKSSCLEIYQAEGKKYSNVNGWRYIEPSDNRFNLSSDKCEITYRDQNRKTKAVCEEIFAATKKSYEDLSRPVSPSAFDALVQCLEGTFTNEF